MSKYIIELDENAKKVVAISLEDGIMWTDETEVENLEELNSDYINEHFGDLQDEAYKRGFEAGKKVSEEGCVGCAYADKVVTGPPCITCCNSYVNQWRAKKQDDEIKVGDEVRSTYAGKVMEDFTPWVVTLVTSETCYGFDADGNPRNNPNTMVQKTGRRFDIDKILGELRE